jgi:hypothetical protein
MRGLLVVFAFALLPGVALADFAGRVVKVSDDDTLTLASAALPSFPTGLGIWQGVQPSSSGISPIN